MSCDTPAMQVVQVSLDQLPIVQKKTMTAGAICAV